MVGAGYSEAQSMSFLGAGELDLLRLPGDDTRRKAIRVSNPLREEESLLRTTLLPGLLRAAAGNLDRGSRRRHPVRDRQGLPPHSVVARPASSRSAQPSCLRGRGRAAAAAGVLGARREVDAYEATALVRLLGEARGLDLRVYPGEKAPFHPGRSGMVLLDKEVDRLGGRTPPRGEPGFRAPRAGRRR